MTHVTKYRTENGKTRRAAAGKKAAKNGAPDKDGAANRNSPPAGPAKQEANL